MAFMSSCSNDEESAAAGSLNEIKVDAGIGKSTRAVIESDYAFNLEMSFARIDEPGTKDVWTAIVAERAAGGGDQAVEFTPKQVYLDSEAKSGLIGYYPRAALANATNPATVSYTITGDEDIMATELQTGASTDKFKSFTFQHLLTQLQFKCTGSADAIKKWSAITSIKVKDVSTSLTLSLDKTSGASLATGGGAPASLGVLNCPTKVSKTNDAPTIGYLMLYPESNMGTSTSAINLEVEATYDNVPKTLTVPVNNITGGVKKGESHLITLTFAEDGTIAVEAGIADWKNGNGGSSTVTPKGI